MYNWRNEETSDKLFLVTELVCNDFSFWAVSSFGSVDVADELGFEVDTAGMTILGAWAGSSFASS